MLILSIESSGKKAQGSLFEDEKNIINIEMSMGLTHSQTLLPIISELFFLSKKYSVKDLKKIIISAGPGSFTGLRIGMAIAKGLSIPYGIEVIGVSTLDSLSENVSNNERVVIPIMDARANRVFFNIYYKNKKYFKDMSIDIEVLTKCINKFNKLKYIFVGDGIDIYNDYLSNNLKVDFIFANKNHRYQDAKSTFIVGMKNDEKIKLINYVEKSKAEKGKPTCSQY
ncbi:MAG: tRNA (adenosine(37)-N6)-threonylcarbamoyltransferase complex dimerization subunit type 1 TsaB [Eubacteriales bacterium]|nr:tRNA (adenosine(37)-N6)-threonylcarbamoyltransferase complex dimerization subunit type 1 TsaB [Eubacteriales bacterium]